jgi:hypothetical protein
MSTLNQTASWVIVRKQDDQVIFETMTNETKFNKFYSAAPLVEPMSLEQILAIAKSLRAHPCTDPPKDNNQSKFAAINLELLEALEGLYTMIESNVSKISGINLNPEMHKAREAIAKARESKNVHKEI